MVARPVRSARPPSPDSIALTTIARIVTALASNGSASRDCSRPSFASAAPDRAIPNSRRCAPAGRIRWRLRSSTRKLSSCFLPILTLPGLMRYFASARAHVGILLEQQVAVVVEVADNRHAHAEFIQASRRSSAPPARPRRCSPSRAPVRTRPAPAPSPGSPSTDVGGIGIRHRLDHDGVVPANFYLPYAYRHRTTAWL